LILFFFFSANLLSLSLFKERIREEKRREENKDKKIASLHHSSEALEKSLFSQGYKYRKEKH